MDNCTDCGKKITCCKCGKLLCEPHGTIKTHGVNDTQEQPCRIIGYYKITEDTICTDCHGHPPKDN